MYLFLDGPLCVSLWRYSFMYVCISCLIVRYVVSVLVMYVCIYFFSYLLYVIGLFLYVVMCVCLYFFSYFEMSYFLYLCM